MIRLIALSDTHTKHNQIKIPKGDILIFAGDFEVRNQFDLYEMKDWFNSLDFKKIVFIFGNHDWTQQYDDKTINKIFGKNRIYLNNSSCKIGKLKIWGSSFSPLFNDWAWMKEEGELNKIWKTIPQKTNIVITHCPPYGILDETSDKRNVGSWTLGNRIKEIKPKLHIFGHIQEQGNKYFKDKYTTYCNVSVLNENYEVKNPCTIIDI